MFPVLSFSDRAYGGRRDPVLSRQMGAAAALPCSTHYFRKRRRWDLCHAMTFAAVLSAFDHLVFGVFLGCRRKQMIGIYALRIIAAMASAHSVGELADPQFVSHAMSALVSKRRIRADLPITVNKRALPLPAAITRDPHRSAQRAIQGTKFLCASRVKFCGTVSAYARLSNPLAHSLTRQADASV